MVEQRPVRRRPSPPPRRGSEPRLRGPCAVPIHRANPAPHVRVRSSRRIVATCLASLAGLLIALVVPASALAAPQTRTPVPDIEAFAPYQGQNTCDPVARDGVVAFRSMVLSTYPGTGDAGIVRACSVGGTSEHKEGRAWDWRVNAADPAQAAQVEDLLTWLLAPDEQGNTAAMARRLGVMYVIWNSKVWKSYQAARGWQPYSGGSPHTDHVHLSFSWAGAYAKTSYWSGQVAPVMYAPQHVAAGSGSATPTATVAAAPVDRRAQVARRHGVIARLPGPWRRH